MSENNFYCFIDCKVRIINHKETFSLIIRLELLDFSRQEDEVRVSSNKTFTHFKPLQNVENLALKTFLLTLLGWQIYWDLHSWCEVGKIDYIASLPAEKIWRVKRKHRAVSALSFLWRPPGLPLFNLFCCLVLVISHHRACTQKTVLSVFYEVRCLNSKHHSLSLPYGNRTSGCFCSYAYIWFINHF